ncbi:MAG: energy-coupling factor ABC transporter ATP-binding protein [Nitrososphaeria archaeon]|nr:energy-coupling factor ABC transporter ATP-binding protein [Nitrososphaeria archaeon]
METLTEIIRFINFSFSYSGSNSPILKNINLLIEEGDFVLLVGPSGCGKSTLLRCINGLIPHLYNGVYEGEVIVDGEPVKNKSVNELATKVGFVFQNPENQIFMFSVEKDIVFGLENIGLDKTEIDDRLSWVLRALDIEHLRYKPPYELSDGQKQRVAIAGVLAMKPKILILDEPTSLLDPRTALEFISLLKELNRKFGLTIIAVEHRIDLLTNVANRMVVMDKGEIVFNGCLKDVIENKNLNLHGVNVPPVIALQNYLRNEGFIFDAFYLNVKEFSKEIKRRLLEID